jgi:hypothetical protein
MAYLGTEIATALSVYILFLLSLTALIAKIELSVSNLYYFTTLRGDTCLVLKDLTWATAYPRDSFFSLVNWPLEDGVKNRWSVGDF